MNIDLNKMFESKPILLILLGAIFILIAALSGVPTGSQTILSIDTGWRYVIAITGIVLLAGGIFLVVKEFKDIQIKRITSNDIIKSQSDQEYSQYMVKKLREAKESVSDLTYEGFPSGTGKVTLFFNSVDHDEYLHIIEEISKRVKCREIIMFNGKENRISKAKRFINYAGKFYQLAGYADLPDNAPPRHNFIIIDDEVFLKGLVIRQPELVDYYRNFYDELWRFATPIQASTVKNLELLEIAEKKMVERLSK